MKKKIVLFIFLLSLFFLSIFFFNKKNRINDLYISDEEYNSIIKNKTYNYNISFSNLKFGDYNLLRDSNQNYYYSTIENDPSKYNPKISYDNSGYKVAIYGSHISDDSIKNNDHQKILIYDDSEYNEFDLITTTLPILSIHNKQECNSREDVKGYIYLFDNRNEAVQREINSLIKMHVRGASSFHDEKNNFRLTLLKESTGNNERENNISLLGLRKDADYILYSTFRDPEKIRNVFSSSIWLDTCAENPKSMVNNYIEYRYVELIINGEYRGLYALGYKVDKNSAQIGSKDILYRISTFSYINSKEFNLYEEIENHTEVVSKGNNVSDVYTPIQQFYESIFNINENNYLVESSIVDIYNNIDYFLFINLTQAYDNYHKNRLYDNCFLIANYDDGMYKFDIVPWDLDNTWGAYHDYLDLSLDENIVVTDSITNKICEISPEFKNEVKERYKQLRNTIWSNNSLIEKISKYEKDIFYSGAFARDLIRWPDDLYENSHHSNVDVRLNYFKEKVEIRLKFMDDFINSY